MSRRKYRLLLLGFLILSFAVVYPMLSNPSPSDRQPFNGPMFLDQEQNADRNLVYTELRVTVSMNTLEFLALQHANQAYSEQYPEVYVQLENITDGQVYEQMVQAAQLGESADVMLLDNMWIHEFASNGYLMPTDPLITGDHLSELLPGLLQHLKWNGYLWAVPKDADPLVMIWNLPLLSLAELQEPPNDWSSFIAATERLDSLNREDDAQAILWSNLSWDEAREGLLWLAAMGGLEASQPLQTGSLNTVGEEQIRFVEAGGERFDNLTAYLDSRQLVEMFEQGRLLSAIVPWSMANSLSQEGGKQLLSVMEPVLAGQPLWLDGRSYAISSRTANEQYAIRWIEMMTSSENQKLVYEQFGKLPARKSLYASASSQLQDSGFPSPSEEWIVRFQDEPAARVDRYTLRAYEHFKDEWSRWRSGEVESEGILDYWAEEIATVSGSTS